MEITTIGVDIAKNVFQVHGVDAQHKPCLKKCLKRARVLEFFAQLPACLIGMEACASSHYWARKLTASGHTVKLINPGYVKPYVNSQKKDAHDAEAICEAVSRPSMRVVPEKSIAQQDAQALHRVRKRLDKQRTALSNQIRGLLGEYGLVIAKGFTPLRRRLPEFLEDAENELTPVSRTLFAELYEEVTQVDERVKSYGKQIDQQAKDDENCQRLMGIPGIGPMISTALVMVAGNGSEFTQARHLGAFLGLVPQPFSSGGKTRLGRITKRGDRYVRSLLVHGARSVVSRARKHPSEANAWVRGIIERRGVNKACVALANNMTRQAWVILSRNETCQSALAFNHQGHVWI